MAKDWEKLGGERGEVVPSGRLSRALTLGKMGARVGASVLATKASALMGRRSGEDLREAYAQSAEHMVEALGKLKGASMKVGQLLSADPELVPDGFGDALIALQSSAPPMTYATVKAQIEAALDRPLEVVFRTFDPEPIGAASIGQVHRAVLDDGREVAVKIQYPGVVDALESDLKSLGTMMSYGRAVVERQRLDAYLDEIRKTIMEEADYRQEGETLERFQEILAGREGVRAPSPVLEWTRETVLVMELVKGVKLDDALEALGPGEARDALLQRWVQLYAWMFHELFEMHADPHPGNFLLEEDGTLVMLDFGSVKKFNPEFADGLLDILDTCWQGQPERAAEIYIRMGFGGDDLTVEDLDPNLIDDYHKIVLAPFLKDAPFDFGGWAPGMESKAFMLRNPKFLKLMPPSEALPYFRMLSGVKGLLGRFDASLNICQHTLSVARKRGRLTGEPLFI